MNKSRNINKKSAYELWQAVLQLKTKAECAAFFRDLCTAEEIRAMAERWQAVKEINLGKPYRAIAKDLNISTATVSRVADWLKNGKGGYRLILKRLKLLK